jgi:LysM repeat protein
MILVVLLALWGVRTTAVTAQSPSQDIFTLVNNYRTANGLPAFQWDGALAAAAQNHANWMGQTQRYSHTQTNGSTPQSRATALGYNGYATENIVGGTNLTAREGLIWWQNSAIHNQTLLSSRYIHAGVGYALSSDGQQMYVLVAGRPSDQPLNANSVNEVQAAPIFVTPIEIAAPRDDGSIIHVVQTGQTAWAIAARYDVPLSDILYFNTLGSSPLLKPGDEIYVRLAEGQAPPPTPTPPLHHIVQEGQTLWTIAAIYNLQLSELLWYNSLSPEAIVQPGDEIKIRLPEGEAPPPTPTPQLAHIVRSGDSFWAVAAQYGLTVDQLLAFNQLTADSIIKPGDELRIRPLDTPAPTPTNPATPTFTPEPATLAQVSAVQATAVPPTGTPVSSLQSPVLTPQPPTATAVPPQTTSPQTFYRSTITVSIGLLLIAGITVMVMARKADG